MNNELLDFVIRFRPVQVLALLPLNALYKASVIELRALARYLNFLPSDITEPDFVFRLHSFCSRTVDQQFLIERPDYDYRLFLYNAISYKESPVFLLNLEAKCIKNCTARQLHLIVRYLHRFVKRDRQLPQQFRQLFYNLVASFEFFPPKTLVSQLEKLYSSSFMKAEMIPKFETVLRLPSFDEQLQSINTEEIVHLYEHFNWISWNAEEAKIIAVGYGLDPKIFWPSSRDYKLFSKACQEKQFYFSKKAIFEQNIPRFDKQGSCFFCCSAEANSVRVPCGHVVGCFQCEQSYKSNHCHVCRQKGMVIKIFKSF
jgi:hypothetical protein